MSFNSYLLISSLRLSNHSSTDFLGNIFCFFAYHFTLFSYFNLNLWSHLTEKKVSFTYNFNVFSFSFPNIIGSLTWICNAQQWLKNFIKMSSTFENFPDCICNLLYADVHKQKYFIRLFFDDAQLRVFTWEIFKFFSPV